MSYELNKLSINHFSYVLTGAMANFVLWQTYFLIRRSAAGFKMGIPGSIRTK